MEIGRVVFSSGGVSRDDLSTEPKPSITKRRGIYDLPCPVPKISGGSGYSRIELCGITDYPWGNPSPIEADSGESFGAWPSTEPASQVLTVDKRTHRIRYENETEDRVDIVIEPKS